MTSQKNYESYVCKFILILLMSERDVNLTLVESNQENICNFNIKVLNDIVCSSLGKRLRLGEESENSCNLSLKNEMLIIAGIYHPFSELSKHGTGQEW